MAQVIAHLSVPTLIISPNKTLAGQLYAEFCRFFPKNRVEYFISYYDYYRPESYSPTKDLYLEKDAQVNPKIEMMRLSTTTSLISRKDVIVVASVSCIYGLGSPDTSRSLSHTLSTGKIIPRARLLRALIDLQYERNDVDPSHGKFRVRGDTIDIGLSYRENEILRIELFGDEIEHIRSIHAITGEIKEEHTQVIVFPAKHYVSSQEEIQRALISIQEELATTLPTLPALEAERLSKRVHYDLEMIREMGYCSGIENYSRHFEGRKEGTPPFCLLDYFPEDGLIIIDESHVSLPQIQGMYKGDFSRKKNLVDNGFRLPCAYDNRPLKNEEFMQYIARRKTLFVSATPGDFEMRRGPIVEQIIRPTGLVDPQIEVRPTLGQVDDLIKEIQATVKKGFRTLVTTLTKRMAEDLTDHLAKSMIKVRYLHSDIEPLERTELLRQLRQGEFDVLVGINLLREGLDLPEVALVAILDADKEGFLRSARSLIQTVGRAARNIEGKVIFYGDVMTPSMKLTIDETGRRRALQVEFNKQHNITPQSIFKPLEEKKITIKTHKHIATVDLHRTLVDYEAKMKQAAEELEFEKAIELRDAMTQIQKQLDERR